MSDRARMMECYRPQYGMATDALFEAMTAPIKKIALINPFLPHAVKTELQKKALRTHAFGEQFIFLPSDCTPFIVDGLLSHYFLDLSSIFAPLLLPLASNAKALDMCSAPGGKLLVMLSRMIEGVSFTANDMSRARALRLKRVVEDFVPREFSSDAITITTKDATYFGLKMPNSFDTILLDAPCSSEAHILADEKLLRNFSGLRKTLPQRQYSLLAAALLALRPGGHVMYATCSINQMENEKVIERALKKKASLCEIVPLTTAIGEQSSLGVTILPHLHGAGPAFLSLLRRV